MGNVKVELNKEGVRALLRSEELRMICKEYADLAASKLGAGYSTSDYIGRNRVNASVGAETKEARQENMENNTILKAVQSS